MSDVESTYSPDSVVMLSKLASRLGRPLMFVHVSATTYLGQVQFGITHLSGFLVRSDGSNKAFQIAINPENPIDASIPDCLISPVEGAKPFSAYATSFLRRLEDSVLIGFNTMDFHLPAIIHQALRYKFDVPNFPMIELKDVWGVTEPGVSISAYAQEELGVVLSENYDHRMAELTAFALEEALIQAGLRPLMDESKTVKAHDILKVVENRFFRSTLGGASFRPGQAEPQAAPSASARRAPSGNAPRSNQAYRGAGGAKSNPHGGAARDGKAPEQLQKQIIDYVTDKSAKGVIRLTEAELAAALNHSISDISFQLGSLIGAGKVNADLFINSEAFAWLNKNLHAAISATDTAPGRSPSLKSLKAVCQGMSAPVCVDYTQLRIALQKAGPNRDFSPGN